MTTLTNAHTHSHTHSHNFLRDRNGEVGGKLRNINNCMLLLPSLMLFSLLYNLFVGANVVTVLNRSCRCYFVVVPL